jgi:hypothetical protein
MTFADIYILRLGAGITLPSACTGFALQGQPPAILPATPYGQGLPFRFVLTPQVWSVGGEVGVGFDGRDGDTTVTDAEVARFKVLGNDTVRFAIRQPSAGGTGLTYARLASVSAPVQGVNRQYECVLGISTLPADLPASPSGDYGRTVLAATAYVREGSAARTYSLGRSVVAIAADQAGKRVTISVKLIGTPTGASGPDLDLGTYAASAPIDPATGNFVANLTSSDRMVTAGTLSGRFFGPQAAEVGAALSASVAASPSAPNFTFAGAAYGIR